MYFASIQAEVLEQLNDSGPLYVQENGKLRSPWSPRMEPPTLSGKRSRKEVASHSQETIPSVNSRVVFDACNRTPSKLFHICIDFVAEHISMVDSLCNFPEIVGRSLFDACEKKQKFDATNTEAHEAMSLFHDAYGNIILEELDLNSSYLSINNHIDFFCLFHHLKKLDLKGCQLGDDHELLQQIGQMRSLTHLSVQDNTLTDLGIQRMTTPLRIFKNGPKKLHTLDLSCNPEVSDKVVRFIFAFEYLEALDLSGTEITASGIAKIEKNTMLREQESHMEEFLNSLAENKGWAAQVVAKWITSSPVVKPQPAAATGTKDSFYGHNGRAKRLELLTRQPLSFNRPVASNKIQLRAATLALPEDTCFKLGDDFLQQSLVEAQQIHKEPSPKQVYTVETVKKYVMCNKKKLVKQRKSSKDNGTCATEHVPNGDDKHLIEGYLQASGMGSHTGLWNAMNSQYW